MRRMSLSCESNHLSPPPTHRRSMSARRRPKLSNTMAPLDCSLFFLGGDAHDCSFAFGGATALNLEALTGSARPATSRSSAFRTERRKRTFSSNEAGPVESWSMDNHPSPVLFPPGQPFPCRSGPFLFPGPSPRIQGETRRLSSWPRSRSTRKPRGDFFHGLILCSAWSNKKKTFGSRPLFPFSSGKLRSCINNLFSGTGAENRSTCSCRPATRGIIFDYVIYKQQSETMDTYRRCLDQFTYIGTNSVHISERRSRKDGNEEICP